MSETLLRHKKQGDNTLIYKAIFFTDEIIRKDKNKKMIDQLRAAIISTVIGNNIFTEEERRFINFRPPAPYFNVPVKLIFAQPSLNGAIFELFAFEEDGRVLLEKIGKALENKTLTIQDEKIKVKSFKLLDGVSYLPSPLEIKEKYYTTTYIILHDKQKDFNEWFAITKKFEETKNKEDYEKEMKRSIINLIKANIKYQLKLRVKDRNYNFIDDINIEINEFQFVLEKYHKDQRPAPMLFMKFTSDWKLPFFIGHHIGKGYGYISLDKKVVKDV